MKTKTWEEIHRFPWEITSEFLLMVEFQKEDLKNANEVIRAGLRLLEKKGIGLNY